MSEPPWFNFNFDVNLESNEVDRLEQLRSPLDAARQNCKHSWFGSVREGYFSGKDLDSDFHTQGLEGSYRISVRSSMWLHIATNRSKNILPPCSISICMVPLLLKVLRLRMMRAR